MVLYRVLLRDERTEPMRCTVTEPGGPWGERAADKARRITGANGSISSCGASYTCRTGRRRLREGPPWDDGRRACSRRKRPTGPRRPCITAAKRPQCHLTGPTVPESEPVSSARASHRPWSPATAPGHKASAYAARRPPHDSCPAPPRADQQQRASSRWSFRSMCDSGKLQALWRVPLRSRGPVRPRTSPPNRRPRRCRATVRGTARHTSSSSPGPPKEIS